MASRLTWTEFTTWLRSQKNTREVRCKDAKNCPIAAFVRYKTKAKLAYVYNNTDIEYITADGDSKYLKGPLAMRTFIIEFDKQKINTMVAAKEIARKITNREIKNA